MRLEEAKELVARELQSFRMEDGTLVYHTLSFLVESEKGPLWKQYLVNPTISYEDVIYVVLVRTTLPTLPASCPPSLQCIAAFCTATFRYPIASSGLLQICHHESHTMWLAVRFSMKYTIALVSPTRG